MLKINAYLAIAVAIIFLLNSFFVVDNQQLRLRMQALQQAESELIEQNKQSLIAISLLRSPKYLLSIINQSNNFRLRTAEQIVIEAEFEVGQVPQGEVRPNEDELR